MVWRRVVRRGEVETEKMKGEQVVISTSGPRVAYINIHSLFKFLYLKRWCVDVLILTYSIAEDAQLRALKRAFGNYIQQTILRLKFLRFLPGEPATWPTWTRYFPLQHPPPGRLGGSSSLSRPSMGPWSCWHDRQGAYSPNSYRCASQRPRCSNWGSKDR